MNATRLVPSPLVVLCRYLAVVALLVLSACHKHRRPAEPIETSYWSGSYLDTNSTGSIAFTLAQQGDGVTGSCKMSNKIRGTALDFTLSKGKTDSTGFSFEMDATAPTVGRYSGRARYTGPTSMTITFQGSSTAGPLSTTATVTSVRGNGVWIGMWQSPQMQAVSFGLRLSQTGGNLVGTMLTFQSTVGVPTAFDVDGEVEGEAMHLRLHPLAQSPVEDTIELFGVLTDDSMDLTWAGNDGIAEHQFGTGAAMRVNPFTNSSSDLYGVWAGMIGSQESQTFAVMEIRQFNGIQYGISVYTDRNGSPRHYFGSTVYPFYPIPISVFSTTPGCGGQLDMSLRSQAPLNFNVVDVFFTGHDCGGNFTNGEWSPARL